MRVSSVNDIKQNEVKQQTLVTTIRSYLKLYSTISTSKLTNFLKADEQHGAEDDQIRTYLFPSPSPPLLLLSSHFFLISVSILMCYKHKTRNLVWNGGSSLTGKWTSSSDVDFYVEKGTPPPSPPPHPSLSLSLSLSLSPPSPSSPLLILFSRHGAHCGCEGDEEVRRVLHPQHQQIRGNHS